MFGLRKYNYESFTRDLLMKDVLLDQFGGPKPGERAPDFRAKTLEGEPLVLSERLHERNVVLTFGSGTCPFTAGSIRELNKLYRIYNGEEVQFLFVYVREAHPGERLPAHQNIEDKERAAKLFRRREQVEIPILLDDLKGSIHRKYGKLPNPTFLIDKSGRVAFRNLSTRPGVVAKALKELLQRQSERDVQHAIVLGGEDTSIPSAYGMLYAHRALERGGPRAVEDFRREMGFPGRVALAAGRVVQPVADRPAMSVAALGLAAGVVAGGILLGRYLRERRFRTPYEIEDFGVPRRGASHGDYEAVGI